jgi:hypothetical protein
MELSVYCVRVFRAHSPLSCAARVASMDGRRFLEHDSDIWLHQSYQTT